VPSAIPILPVKRPITRKDELYIFLLYYANCFYLLYSGWLHCVKCNYQTCCERAQFRHGVDCNGNFVDAMEVNMLQEMHCICGFATSNGNKMAQHLANCGLSTCYSSLEAANENAIKRNMLDMLGLVRRDGETSGEGADIGDAVDEPMDDNNDIIPSHISPEGKQHQFQCLFCLEKHATESVLAKHNQIMHPTETKTDGSPSYYCLICQQRHNSLHLLTAHLQKVHSTLELPYWCQACGYRSSSHRDLVRHFYDDHKNQNFLQCPYCLDVSHNLIYNHCII